MRSFSVDADLQKTLEKLFKRDRSTYEALMGKMQEILTCSDVTHYKNLRRPLHHLKRVHVKGPFVLIFKSMPAEDKVVFYDFDHHDNIYD